MLDNKEWDEGAVLTVIADREQNSFTVKETIETLEADWDSTEEILNEANVFAELLAAW
jgi:hypothetical protein